MMIMIPWTHPPTTTSQSLYYSTERPPREREREVGKKQHAGIQWKGRGWSRAGWQDLMHQSGTKS